MIDEILYAVLLVIYLRGVLKELRGVLSSAENGQITTLILSVVKLQASKCCRNCCLQCHHLDHL